MAGRKLLWCLGLIALFIGSCAPEKKCSPIDFNQGWQINSSENISADGAIISKPEFTSEGWYDIKLPSTILSGLIQNEVYTNVYFENNLEKIDTKQFQIPWWYRKSFDIQKSDEDYYVIEFEGINYKANIWLNGELIADQGKIEGPFGMWEFDITDMLVDGTNALAIEVIPPVKGDLTIGFVDWNPWAPDNNMGLWRGVNLVKSGNVSIDDPFVQTDVDTETLEEATLLISTDITNHSNEKSVGKVTATVNGATISTNFEIEAGETKEIKFTKDDYAELIIKNPKLWWPIHMGDPNLYTLELTAEVNGKITDQETVQFGIREIEEYMTKDKHKGYKINGENFLIRGGGWVDDILLADTDEKVRAQVEYTKHMNLNTIRLEGFWGNNKTLYEECDKNGILLFIGWSCHWEWEGYCGRKEDRKYMSIFSEYDQELQARAFQDQVVWLRNHPSIFMWAYGSDKLPLPSLERKLNAYINEVDPTRPIISSCKYEHFRENFFNDSEVSGPSGTKMLGPYAYVTPNYWYEDKELGGAYGFNTETGPGPQVPPIESMRKMMKEEDLWPMGEMWNYHNGRNEFQTLDRYITAFNARYGEANSAEDFTSYSQISNYEAIRAMFEAFAVNKFDATGVIQWMLNSAWPNTVWQLYDWYLMPNGAFYGTKSACHPLHMVYNYADNNIYLTTEYLEKSSDLQAQIKVLDINGQEILSEVIATDIEGNSSKMIFEMPELENVTTTYFLSLKVLDKAGSEISNNFYWLSTKKDVSDYENSQWHWTPNKEFADFTAIRNMPKVKVDVQSNITQVDGKYHAEVTLKNNTDKVAFFIELAIKGETSGLTALPVFWDDNYVSLLPGEERIVKAELDAALLEGDTPVFSYNGINVE